MITTMRSYWRRRLAEDLDLPPEATWYDVEQAVIAVKADRAAAVADAARAQRDRREMQLFLTQSAHWWWEAGKQGEGPPGAA